MTIIDFPKNKFKTVIGAGCPRCKGYVTASGNDRICENYPDGCDYAMLNGKLLHTCEVCGKHGPWDDDWAWLGKPDDDRPEYKTCSDRCRAKHPAYQKLILGYQP